MSKTCPYCRFCAGNPVQTADGRRGYTLRNLPAGDWPQLVRWTDDASVEWVDVLTIFPMAAHEVAR